MMLCVLLSRLWWHWLRFLAVHTLVTWMRASDRGYVVNYVDVIIYGLMVRRVTPTIVAI